MHRMEHLRTLVQDKDADAFARELKLDPARTRQWFEQGCGPDGDGEEVIRAIGTHLLHALTSPGGKEGAHG